MSKGNIKLNKGDKLIHISKFSKYEVTGEDSLCYYLTIFKGTCSDVKVITKSDPFDSYEKEWFSTEEEMLKQRVKNAERKLESEKRFLSEYLEGKII